MILLILKKKSRLTRLKILSKKVKEKVLDKDAFLAEGIGTFSREQDAIIISVHTVLPITISIIALAIIGIFRQKGGPAAYAPKRLAGKAVEALLALVGSFVGAILRFLGNAVGLVAELIWVLLVFVAGRCAMFDAKG